MNTVPKAKKLDIENIVKLSHLDNNSKDIDRLHDDVLKKKLRFKAQKRIKAGLQLPYRCFVLEEEDKYGNITSIPSVLMVHEKYEKLFEGIYINNVSQSVADYLFGATLGYDNYFSAPVIIVRDSNGDIVDLVKYRPEKEGYENLPKYLQEKAVNKPKNRGDDFLYPFQVEMERIIKKYKYAFLGEGIKNALNALVRSVPYISIESASNVNNPKLIAYINKLHRSGISIFGAMDGDAAGQKAFEEIKKLLECPLENLLDFESGLDFTDYLRKETL